MGNILNRSTIDLMAFSIKNNVDLKSLIKNKDSSWKSPIFGINRDWMVDALEEGRSYESFLLKSMLSMLSVKLMLWLIGYLVKK